MARDSSRSKFRSSPPEALAWLPSDQPDGDHRGPCWRCQMPSLHLHLSGLCERCRAHLAEETEETNTMRRMRNRLWAGGDRAATIGMTDTREPGG